MKKRIHDQKAGIAVLVSLILIALAEMAFRIVLLWKATLTTSNLGEPVSIVILAAFLLTMAAKGKDRLCYLCYGAWASYFVFDQIYTLPGVIAKTASLMRQAGWVLSIGHVAWFFRILSMVCTIAIGALLVKYMNRGAISNRKFNNLCFATIAMILGSVAISLYEIFVGGDMNLVFDILNNLYRITMVFMFTCFAYDSAKHQLKNTRSTK